LTPEQKETWNRIEAFEIDEPGVPAPFSVRLAKEQGWTQGYTLRAIREYKRFAFLSTVSASPITPSKVVDEVWHLHLIYTRNYWEDFCGKALGKRLHHQPGNGREEDESRFQRQYAETLELYRSFFGQEPEDCWGFSQEGSKPETVQTNKSMKAKAFTQSLYSKLINAIGPKVGIGLLAAFLSTQASAQKVSGTASTAKNLGVLDMNGPDFLRFFTVLSFICFIVAVIARYLLARTSRPVDERARLGLYESSFLAQRMPGVKTAAALKLVEEGKIILGADGQISFASDPSNEHPIEGRLLREARIKTGKKLYECFKSLDVFQSSLLETLEPTGLVLNQEERRRTQLVPALIMVAPLLLGIAKIVIGMQRERPVGFLVVESVIVLIIAIAFGCLPCITSRQGDAWVEKAQWKQKSSSQSGASPEQVALIAGVVGVTALSSSQHLYFKRSVASPYSGGTDGGSSCGGGGGGCGGGGCGGCGS